jgi:hypothetical protein
MVIVGHSNTTRFHPVPLGPPKSRVQREKELKSLAKDLRTETSPSTILKHLKALNIALSDPQTSDPDALVFLRAGGLPALIRHLTGNAASGGTHTSDTTLSARIAYAGETLKHVLLSNAVMAELASDTGVVPSLIGVLRSTPSPVAQSAAAQGLMLIAHGQAAHRGVMAEAGVVGMVLDLYVTFVAAQSLPWALMEPPLDLARLLVCSQMGGVEDLARGIQSLERTRCFGALVVLQVSRNRFHITLRTTVT